MLDWIFSGIGTEILKELIFKKKESADNQDNQKIIIELKMDAEILKYVDSLKKTTKELIDRFLYIFKLHNIEHSEIPIFIDKKFNIRYSDISSEEKLLDKLNDDLFEWTVNTFGINKEWIFGISDMLYPTIDFYKDIFGFIDFVKKLSEKSKIQMYAFKNGVLDKNSNDEQSVYLIMTIPIRNIDNKVIYRFIPITTSWKWDYWRSRYQLKSIFYIFTKYFGYIHGYDLKNHQDFWDFLKGKISFEKLLKQNNPLGSYTWYPEDYIYDLSESVQAKDVDEIEAILKYIKEGKYIEYLKGQYRKSFM